MRGNPKHVVMYSGGLTSFATAKQVIKAEGPENVKLLFADVKIEDWDLYRFLGETAGHLGADIEVIADGRNPWEVFRDERFIGNTRADPCSKILKRELMRKWVETRFTPADVIVYLGIDWTETNRQETIRSRWAPYETRFPLCDPPYMTQKQIMADLEEMFIKVPRLYAMGFPHNNCGGFCVKAGQAQFKLLLETMPERYAWHEQQEENLRTMLGKDVAIMRDRRGGETRPLTMREFRERVKCGSQVDLLDWGGCGCATD